ncbi:BRE1 E3 ubiquitin ligase [Phlyctema vagabunda]|uniref:E3 ubiquitin protein ligase n=1 Tax=Phlyctema vagabunda TaxID=108571 RepID=A0ABR4P7W8_9HELO
MPVAASAASLPSSFIKMEDRKRSAGQSAEDIAPPTKRQAINGGSKASLDADMPWKDDLEKYQKDAIYRQMLEYKREKATLESQLKDIQKKSLDHNDHLRVIDAWWSQLLDEVRLLAEDEIPDIGSTDATFKTALQFKNSEEFSNHLATKGKEIKSKLQSLFTRLSASRGQPLPDTQDLQAKLAKLLASQKEYSVKLQSLRDEKEGLSERLETASLRYIKAEKRLDRAKSSAVAKLEQQAIAGTGNSAGSGIGGVETNGDVEMTNGIKEESEASQTAYKEAAAVVGKQKEQLDTIMSENKSLQEQLTAASAKLANLTEDDYARTELFKQFRTQHEDVIKRINHLEATNIQLRHEAEKYQAERTAYRVLVEDEAEIANGELQSQLQRMDVDITRIRSARDELVADQAMRKASQEVDQNAQEHMRELAEAKQERINALELQVERLSAQDKACEATPRAEVETMNFEDLRSKYESLEQNFASINKELPAMERAYKKSAGIASKKVMDFGVLEGKVSQALAEKAKADQKYFAARKDMDIRLSEVRALKTQNAKSSEIISQLKDVETSNRTLLSNLEKQLTEVKQANVAIAMENKKLSISSGEANSKAEALKHSVEELQNQLKMRDATAFSTKQRIQAIELELEQLRVRYEQAQKERDSWKAKSLSNQSGEEEMLRTLALCTICRKDFKNTVLKTCGHLFCNNCVDDRIANRMRKCPNCAKSFDKMDVMAVHM